MKPLTKEQIWGVPEEELPTEVPKDYFDYAKQEDSNHCDSQAAGQGEEIDR